MDIDNFFLEIKREIKSYFQVNSERIMSGANKVSVKSDKSIVTEIDIEVSELVKKIADKVLPEVCFFSEEHHLELSYPSIVIDPIDGTKEFSQAIGECCVSISFLNSENIDDPNSRGWIYNPFTSFEIDSENLIISKQKNYFSDYYLGMVSRTEWGKGIYKDFQNPKVLLVPRGSIAYKLGLLAAGSCDFIFTAKPKNIWDISAGVIILQKHGFSFFIENQRVKEFTDIRLPKNMIWCHESIHNEIIGAMSWLF